MDYNISLVSHKQLLDFNKDLPILYARFLCINLTIFIGLSLYIPSEWSNWRNTKILKSGLCHWSYRVLL